MPEPRRIHLLSNDPALVRDLARLGTRLGAVVAPLEADGRPAAGSLVCLDEAHPVASAEGIAALTSSGTAVLWLSPAPRGDRAVEALTRGASDVLALPLVAAEARARLAGLLDRPPTTPVHTGLEVAERLLDLREPGDPSAKLEQALGALFPAARRHAVTLGDTAPPGTGGDGGPGDGSRAAAPMEAAGEVLGWVAVEWDGPQAVGPGDRDRLRAFAASAARALRQGQRYATLSQGKAEWERSFDALTDTVAILGPDFRIRRANRALAALAGMPPAELVGKACHRVLDGRTEVCPDCTVRTAFATGTATRAEREVVRGGRAYAYHAYPLHDERGRLYAVLAYGRDVTREEQLQRSLRQSERLATVGQIASGIAEQINDPLTAISSYAQLLLLHADDPRSRESARRVTEGAGRIQRLVQSLTSFAHPEEEGFFPLDLNELVGRALDLCRYEIALGETVIVQDLVTPAPRVLGAKSQLEHLLVNLLTNAGDAVAGRGVITVATRSNNGHATVEVSDDGMGLSQEALEQLFDPFFTTKTGGKGSGLGLFVAAGIAAKHRGTLTAQRTGDTGTRMTLSLPSFST